MIKLANFLFLKDITLAVKENIDYIKSEISSQEQLLESAIKGERFFKRNKKWFIIAAIIIVVALVSYSISNAIQEANQAEVNRVYNTLISHPDDSNAKQILISKNPSLYALFVIKTADLNSTALIDEAMNLEIDPLLKEILINLKGQKSAKILSNYNALVDGYELLKDGKIDAAKTEFAKIPLNSPLLPIAKNLEHYQGK